MKIIASFDAAILNLGVCYVEFDDEWKSKLEIYIKKINNIGNDPQKILDLLKEINTFLDNIIKIIFFNVIDLTNGEKSQNIPMITRTQRLKHLLKSLDNTLPYPDIVLVEYQMKHNDISRTISNQISMWYSDIINDKTIKYAVKNFPINFAPTEKKDVLVDLVGPTLKNTVSMFDKGSYDNFIVKWSNYTANKKHTSANFKKFAEVFLPDINLFEINNKIDDIADGFLMIFAWLKKKKLL